MWLRSTKILCSLVISKGKVNLLERTFLLNSECLFPLRHRFLKFMEKHSQLCIIFKMHISFLGKWESLTVI